MRAGAEFCGATGMRKGDGEREERDVHIAGRVQHVQLVLVLTRTGDGTGGCVRAACSGFVTWLVSLSLPLSLHTHTCMCTLRRAEAMSNCGNSFMMRCAAHLLAWLMHKACI
eukprot:Tamp_30805.p2 GENE.Tamp_30805~~Tamp_30805.p2  ORF type:complete len:112 (-),score=6.03 Tamp_30805:147-482(-)